MIVFSNPKSCNACRISVSMFLAASALKVTEKLTPTRRSVPERSLEISLVPRRFHNSEGMVLVRRKREDVT